MRSVGLPQFDIDGADSPVPTIEPSSGGQPWLPIAAIVVVGIALVVGLSTLSPDPTVPDSATPTTVSPDTQTTIPTVPDAAIDEPSEAVSGDRSAANLLQLGAAALVAQDEFADDPDSQTIFPTEDGFGRITRFTSGERGFTFSETGTVWPQGAESPALAIDHGMPVVNLANSPDSTMGIVVFRSADGLVFSPSQGTMLTVPALPEARIAELTVGTTAAYATVSEPTADGLRYAVLRISLPSDVDPDAEFNVSSVNLDEELGGDRRLERIRNGIVLADGRVVGIATDRNNTVATLVEFHDDGMVELPLDDTNILNLRRTSTLRAKGTEIIAIDRDGLVFSKRLDQTGFVGSSLPVHPILSLSRNGTLASVELQDDATVVRVWRFAFTNPVEIRLESRIEPVAVAALNETEVLLSTTTSEGEEWLVSVPYIPDLPGS